MRSNLGIAALVGSPLSAVARHARLLAHAAARQGWRSTSFGPYFAGCCLALCLLVLAGPLSGFQQPDLQISTLHVPMPLGQEFYRASSLHRQFGLAVTLESPAYEGLRGSLRQHELRFSNGALVRTYPQPLVFRATLSFLPIAADNGAPLPADLPDEASLLNRPVFALRVNYGLLEQHYSPVALKVIGPPLTDRYPERTYEIAFSPSAPIPIERRISLDVFAPGGFRLAKFYLPVF